jgi:hypothetical protein
VDDFLLLSPDDTNRATFLKSLSDIWKLGKEVTLSPTQPLTFLGIDVIMHPNQDVFLTQERFVDTILEKHDKTQCKGNTTITIAKLPETEDPPTPKNLTKLQSFSGEFNWLATRTRPDLSYFTSVLASACTKHSEWSFEFAQKILRYLKQTKGPGILITCTGDLSELIAWTDAGFAGTDTKSQSGLIVSWGGSIFVWRSTRQTVSALNTAEAELNAASLGWQIVAALRMLMSDFGVEISQYR